MIKFGGFLEAEGGATGIRYFDGGVDFDSALERARRYVLYGATE